MENIAAASLLELSTITRGRQKRRRVTAAMRPSKA